MGDLAEGRKGERTYPAVADNGTGCVFGRGRWERQAERMAEWEGRMDGLEAQMRKLIWVLAAAAVTFGATAIGLGVNLALR